MTDTAAEGLERVGDERLTFADLRAANIARQEYWGGVDSWTLADWSNAVAGEVGEACNVVKKLRRSELGTTGNKATDAQYERQLESEIGDVLIYLDLLAKKAGTTLDHCVSRAFNEKSAELNMPVRLQSLSAAIAVETKPVAWRYRSYYDQTWQFWPAEDWNRTYAQSYKERHPDAQPLYASPQPLAVETKPVEKVVYVTTDYLGCIYESEDRDGIARIAAENLKQAVAASSQPLLDAPRVKALSWENFAFECFTAKADPVGIYATSSGRKVELSLSGKRLGSFGTVYEAKAAAQSHFDTAIRSALQSDGEGR